MSEKSEPKYRWREGEPLPLLEEHSQVKQQLLKDYLFAYIRVYMSNPIYPRLPLTIVDGFAGGGHYLDDVDRKTILHGSPLVVMEAVREGEAWANRESRTMRKIDARYHFVEEDRDAIEFLKKTVASSDKFKHLLNFNGVVNYHHGRFDQKAYKIIEDIGQRDRGQRAIFILDQYGYKDVPFNVVSKIMKELANSEIILTFNVDSLKQYFSDNKNSRGAMRNIGLEKHIDWNRIEQYSEQGNINAAIQEQLPSAILEASGADYITIFFCKPRRGKLYWLVHLSKIYIAKDVMMKLHWKHANMESSLKLHTESSLEFQHYLDPAIFSLGYKSMSLPFQRKLDISDTFNFTTASKNRCVESLSLAIPKIVYESSEKILTIADLLKNKIVIILLPHLNK